MYFTVEKCRSYQKNPFTESSLSLCWSIPSTGMGRSRFKISLCHLLRMGFSGSQPHCCPRPFLPCASWGFAFAIPHGQPHRDVFPRERTRPSGSKLLIPLQRDGHTLKHAPQFKCRGLKGCTSAHHDPACPFPASFLLSSV